MAEYQLQEHKYDVLVVGAGGAGLRATMGIAQQGLINGLYYKSFSNA